MIGYLSPVDYWFGVPLTLRLDPGASDTRTWTRRISRTATLDGGAVVTDGGYSQADRTMTLAIRGLTEADTDTLEEIAAYPVCRLALPHGLYTGFVQSLALNGAETARVTFWVYDKLL